MKYSWILFFASICFACHSSAPQGRSCKTMTLDCSDNLWSVDVSHLFESNLEIIPLETTDSVIINNPVQIILHDGYEYIADNAGVYKFERGKWVASVLRRGNAPDEYINVSDFFDYQAR